MCKQFTFTSFANRTRESLLTVKTVFIDLFVVFKQYICCILGYNVINISLSINIGTRLYIQIYPFKTVHFNVYSKLQHSSI